MNQINVTRSSMPSFEEYCAEIKDLWESRWLTNMGAKHDRFQKRLESYLNVPHVTLFTNGHLALEESIRAFGFPAGSEVITTPFTFASTTHAIVRNNLVPVFCDIRREDLTMDPTLIEGLISEKTVAILPVHVYGNMCAVREIGEIAKRHGLKLIYDAAHAFGVRLNGRSAACFGDISVFSFHATKVFHTIEGGAACCREEALVQKLEDLKNYGIRDEETVAAVGGNAKMSEFQAAMGICNLRHINRCISGRKKAAERYRERLSGAQGLRLLDPQKDVQSNYSYFPVLFETDQYTRDEAAELLAANGIFARKYFYPLTSDFACYCGLGRAKAAPACYRGQDQAEAAPACYCGLGRAKAAPADRPETGRQDTPAARQAAEQVLTLPLYPELTVEEIDRICHILLKKQ